VKSISTTSKQHVSAVWMADAVSPRRRHFVGYYWPSTSWPVSQCPTSTR